MMWPARAAIRPVPTHAVVPEAAVEEVEAEFSGSDDLETRVDRAFLQFDEQQPAIAKFIAAQIEHVADETAQALGHFLGVAIHEAFVTAFGARLRRVEQGALDLARASLEYDEELRRGAPDEVLESDDVVAISQPHVVGFVREQLDSVLEPDEDGDVADVDLEAVAGIYRAVLIEIVALSAAVGMPAGSTARDVYLA